MFVTKTQTMPTEAELLAGATATITLMTAVRMNAGMLPEAAVIDATAAFIKRCEAKAAL